MYDNGDDGYMDGIYMIYAGYGWHAGGPDGSIWAHAGFLAEPITRDGVIIHRYACSSELRSNYGTGIERIGTICHEFGHVLGAPDYYDTNGDEGGGDFDGLGDWCLMASGNWNYNSGVSPAHINGFAKVHVYNWADFNLLSVPAVTTLTNSVQYSDSFYKYDTTTANEYFVLENRQQIGFDTHLPGEGMLIYHVHSEYQQGQSANNLNQTHPQKMYIVSQNASTEPNSTVSSYGVINTASCAWNGTGKTVFSDYTVPSSKSWAGEDTNQPISNISGNQQNRTISFSFRDADPEGNLWTGALGTDWHNPGNWADNIVPDPSHDVVIPANVSFFPSISGAPAYCKNLYLVPGSELGIGYATLMIYEDIESYGTIIMATESSTIFAARDVIWGTYAELTVFNDEAKIYCKRGMTFAEGSNIQTTLGSIIFFSGAHNPTVDYDGYIMNKSLNTQLANVISDKQTIYSLVISALSTQPFQINGNLKCNQNRSIRNMYSGIVNLKGNLISENTGSAGISWVNGTLRLTGTNQSLTIPHSAGYLNNLEAANNGTVSFAHPLWLKGNLLVNNGAVVELGTAGLTVDGIANFAGDIIIGSGDGDLRVKGSITWEDSASLTMSVDEAELYCGRSMTFESSTNIDMVRGTVIFYGDNSGIILNHGSSNSLHNVLISKTASAALAISASSTASFIITGDLTNAQNSVFNNFYTGTIYLEGSFTSLNTNSVGIGWGEGTLRFQGSNPTRTISFSHPGDHLNNLYISGSGVVALGANLNLLGYINLATGSFNPGSYTLSLEGNWTKSSSCNFIRGTSTVVFTGSAEQLVNSTTFNILQLDKSSGKLSIGNSIFLTASSYKWDSGTIELNGGNITFQDLADNGLYGSYIVNGGNINITQDAGQSVNLNCSLTINDGTVRVWGGSGDSYWPLSAPASIIMSGGLLEFKDVGIRLLPSGYAFVSDITGGTIRTEGNFYCYREDFQPSGGLVEMSGSNDAELYCNSLSYLFQIKINKSGRSEEAELPETAREEQMPTRSNTVTMLSDIYTFEEILLIAGTLKLNGHRLTGESDMEIFANLDMTNAEDFLKIYGAMRWNSGSTANVTAGIIELSDILQINEGSSFQFGAGNITRMVDSPNSTIENQVSGNSLGSLSLAKIGSNMLTHFNGPQALGVAGTLTLESGNVLIVSATELGVTGTTTTAANTSLELVNSSNLSLNGDVSASGSVLVEEGNLICHNNFVLPVGGTLQISELGSMILDKAYTGHMFGFAGTVNISTGGVLEISNNGLLVGISRTINLDGGTIRIASDLQALNEDTFWGNGTVEFIGSRVSSMNLGAGNYIRNLVFNKPAITYQIYINSSLYVEDDFVVQGGNPALMGYPVSIGRDLIIDGGRLTASGINDHLKVGRSWINNVGVAAFGEGSGTVVFDYINEAYSGTISTETFNIVQIMKESETSIMVSPDATVIVKAGLSIPYARFGLGAGSILKINNSSSISIGTSGEFYAVGSQTNPARLSADSGYYSFNTSAGAKISARYCTFERMALGGIDLAAGSIVDPSNAFYGCTFQNGISGGILLTKNSSEDIVIPQSSFPANTWGSSYNVSHPSATGSIIFVNAVGDFSGASFENDTYNRVSWIVASPNPTVAHSPLPANGATEVLTSTLLRWTYTSDITFADPIGYIVRIGTEPNLSVYQEAYKAGGPGMHLLPPFIDLEEGTNYYWQVTPTTEAARVSGDSRAGALNCPIWSFRTEGGPILISTFPFLDGFETGAPGWTTGVISGTDQWQMGIPTKTKLNSTHAGNKAWVTNLSTNYSNSSNIWLKTPELDFSSLSQPSFSAWLNIWCQHAYDGAILESSVDGGSTWQYVTGDYGFYNNQQTYGAIPSPKWSGDGIYTDGIWKQFSTLLAGLAHQPSVFLRVRFASDSSGTSEGIALDDIRIWDAGTETSFTWAEDFTDLATGTLPAAWSSSSAAWGVQNSNYAGGTAPEMRFSGLPTATGNFTLSSPSLDTSDLSQLTLSFKLKTNHISSSYYLRVYTLVGSTESIIQQWWYPTTSLDAQT
ncbi:MAG: M6 family metalloprotease domain-containing protein, partial [Candidatus Cloacimonadota bacterium]